MATKKTRARRHPNNAKLRRIMQEHDLTRKDISNIVQYSPAMVDAWLFPPSSPNYAMMQDRSMRLLLLETGLGEPSFLIEGVAS